MWVLTSWGKTVRGKTVHRTTVRKLVFHFCLKVSARCHVIIKCKAIKPRENKDETNFCVYCRDEYGRAAWIKVGCNVQGVVDGHTKVAPAGDPKNSTIFNAYRC